MVVGAIGAATNSGSGQLDLRTGFVPWALGTITVGVGLMLLGSYRGGIGRPPRLARWGTIVSLAGLAGAAVFFVGMGILAAVGSNLLNTGETFASALGTLIASVFTLLILPFGLLAFGVAVLRDKGLTAAVRALPLVGTLLALVGPVLVAVLPDSSERTVFIVWPLLLGGAWGAYGVLVATK